MVRAILSSRTGEIGTPTYLRSLSVNVISRKPSTGSRISSPRSPSERCTLSITYAELLGKALHVTLDEHAAQKLAAMAERMHVNEGDAARSPLTSAIDDSEPDAANLVVLLDWIPGAWQDAQDGWHQAQQGDTVPLDDLYHRGEARGVGAGR